MTDILIICALVLASLIGIAYPFRKRPDRRFPCSSDRSSAVDREVDEAIEEEVRRARENRRSGDLR